MTKKIIAVSAALLLAMPLVAFGAAFSPGPVPAVYGGTIYTLIGDVLFPLLWLGFTAFAVVMFVMAGIEFFTAQGDASKVADARNFVIWGAVGVIIAVLAFSLPFILRATVGV